MVEEHTVVNDNGSRIGALLVPIGGSRLVALERRVTCVPYTGRRLRAAPSRSLRESVGRLENAD